MELSRNPTLYYPGNARLKPDSLHRTQPEQRKTAWHLAIFESGNGGLKSLSRFENEEDTGNVNNWTDSNRVCQNV